MLKRMSQWDNGYGTSFRCGEPRKMFVHQDCWPLNLTENRLDLVKSVAIKLHAIFLSNAKNQIRAVKIFLLKKKIETSSWRTFYPIRNEALFLKGAGQTRCVVTRNFFPGPKATNDKKAYTVACPLRRKRTDPKQTDSTKIWSWNTSTFNKAIKENSVTLCPPKRHRMQSAFRCSVLNTAWIFWRVVWVAHQPQVCRGFLKKKKNLEFA